MLGDTGSGSLSDAIEGIEWVIFNARENNIRVMNLSLSTNSTQSWEIDPLCMAVRSAVAAGITVVVAAGNYGRLADGREVHGTISSPGNDPSVITVGAANFRGTLARTDDIMTTFSSRGPTRGSVTVNGVRRVDNLLKPDLVAPGNLVISAGATLGDGRMIWNQIATSNFSALVSAVGITQVYGETQMIMNGTSIAARPWLAPLRCCCRPIPA